VDQLATIQRSLKPQCRVFVQHDAVSGEWEAGITTEQEQYPHWIRFRASAPDLAVGRLMGYLSGVVPDHAVRKRPPSAWLRDDSSPAAEDC
jgi:hypothetical protein